MAHLVECWTYDFENAKNQVDKYKENLENGMSETNKQIEILLSNFWWGDDANKFKEEWEHMTAGEDSLQTRFYHALDSLSRYLEDVKRMYETARQKAIDSAYRNCGY